MKKPTHTILIIVLIKNILRTFEAEILNLFKVTVHLERRFQFSVCNPVNTHRAPTNQYINGKLMELSK